MLSAPRPRPLANWEMRKGSPVASSARICHRMGFPSAVQSQSSETAGADFEEWAGADGGIIEGGRLRKTGCSASSKTRQRGRGHRFSGRKQRITGIILGLISIFWRMTRIGSRVTGITSRITGRIARLTVIADRLTGIILRIISAVYRFISAILSARSIVFVAIRGTLRLRRIKGRLMEAGYAWFRIADACSTSQGALSAPKGSQSTLIRTEPLSTKSSESGGTLPLKLPRPSPLTPSFA